MADNIGGTPQASGSAIDQATNLLQGTFQQQETPVEKEEQLQPGVETLEVDDELENKEEQGVENDETLLETVTQLSEHLGIDPSEFYTLKVPMGDGLEAITLSEMKDKYLGYERERQQFENERDAFQQERTKFQQESSQKGADLSLFGNEKVLEAEGLIQAISAQYNSIDWEQAKQQDAGQAALYKQELNEAYQQALSQRNQALKEAQSNMMNSQREYANNEWKETVKLIPEWNDEKALRSDQAEMLSVMKEYGIHENEFYQTIDHRLLHVMRDFMKLKRQYKDAAINEKRVRNAGVTVRPTVKRGLSIGKQQKALDTKISKAKETHDMRHQVDAVGALLSS